MLQDILVILHKAVANFDSIAFATADAGQERTKTNINVVIVER
jgi:hypothetical protein